MSNQYLDLFMEQVDERFSVDSLNMPTSEWISKNTTIKDKPFSYEDYEFQKQIINDWHPNMDVIKISQVGITEIQIRKALSFLLRNKGTSVIYSLPTEDMYTRVSDTRVKPIITKDKAFNTPQDRDAKVVRSKGTMQFGQSFLYLVAAIEAAATSIPADMVINDEVDLSDQQILSLFGSRMQNSKYKIHQRFSTPSFPSFGIDLNWEASDQYSYFCKCDSCGHWQHPEFTPKFIHLAGTNIPEVDDLTKITKEYGEVLDLGASYVRCERCLTRLNLGNPDNRQWVSKFPSRVDSRGYRIGPFSTSKLDIRYVMTSMWKYQKTEFTRGFYNTVLGLPYSDGNMQIPIADIEGCLTGKTDAVKFTKADRLWVGIDMGKICHVTIGRGDSKDDLEILAIYEKHVDHIVDHVAALVQDYNIAGGCVDRHPFEPTSREIFAASKGKILPVEYRGSKNIHLVYNEFEELSHAQTNPTWFLDNFAGLIRKRKLRISGYGHKKSVLIQHYRDMVREEVAGEPAHWRKLTGEDHYLHSGAFMALAPHLFDVLRFNDDGEHRTMALGLVANMKDRTPNIIGVSNKRLENKLV